jgi:hypothetical protein
MIMSTHAKAVVLTSEIESILGYSAGIMTNPDNGKNGGLN